MASKSNGAVVDEKLEDLYELVHDMCNLDPVKDLLRRYKDGKDGDVTIPEEKRKELRVTADNGRILITENLAAAVRSGVIPIRAVFMLLQEAEENGGQHLFFFKPKSVKVRGSIGKAESIGPALLGAGWNDPKKYPRLQLRPNDFCWADFRIHKAGWVAKLYGHDTFEEEDGEKPDPDVDRVRWVKLVLKDRRTLLLARWLPSYDLLELRVPATNTKLLLDALKEQLKGAVDVDRDFTPWDLSDSRKKLLSEESKYPDLYQCGTWVAIDGESYKLEGSPLLQDPNENVEVSAATRAFVSQVAASKHHDKRRLIVHWKPTGSNGNPGNLRTLIGTNAGTHEVIVTAQASSKALDDLVFQLHRFAT